MERSSAEFILHTYSHLLTTRHDFNFSEIGWLEYYIPRFKEPLLNGLFKDVYEISKKYPISYHLTGEYIIVGGIHGNLVDLLRIFNFKGTPKDMKFVFLGDYVDRGDYSLEVITLLVAFSILYPDNIILLRGNHECQEVNSKYGFREQLLEHYSEKLFCLINSYFENLPIVAVINNSIVCLHGGIGPNFKNIESIESLEKPLSYSMIKDILLSDPSEHIPIFGESPRGIGCSFGTLAIKHFLDASNCNLLIRAHECVHSGIAVFANGLGYTVFSSSGYDQKTKNSSGILILHHDNKLQPFYFKDISKIDRKNAIFKVIDMLPISKRLNTLPKLQATKRVSIRANRMLSYSLTVAQI